MRGKDDGAAPGGAAARRRPRAFHGRRRGKRLGPARLALLGAPLAALRVPGLAVAGLPAPESNLADPDRPRGDGTGAAACDGLAAGAVRIEPEAIFGNAGPVWLEIGFGAGEHLLAEADRNPGVNLIGCEPFVNGVAALMAQLAARPRPNIRIHPGDALDVVAALPARSLQRVFLLYPDPWPKARHHKRRFVSAGNLTALARVMAAGAELRIASDVADYAEAAMEVLSAHPGFAPVQSGASEVAWTGWTSTRYERKAIKAGRRPRYLTWRRG